MSDPQLDRLPVELLQKILANLPSTDALACTLICRSIYTACNHWSAWRDLVATQHTLPHARYSALRKSTDYGIWKRYVVADALARQYKVLQKQDIERWLLPMIALQRTLYTIPLYNLPIFHNPAVDYAYRPYPLVRRYRHLPAAVQCSPQRPDCLCS